jgi:diacylglycerol kinase (ATP)
MRIWRATCYSWQGLRTAVRCEAAFRQELALAVILEPVGLWFGANGMERALLLVLITELLNSGVEAAIDRHGPETHELAGRAKDLGSAAVFIALLNVPVTWGLLLLD